jgi:hypothetical protein
MDKGEAQRSFLRLSGMPHAFIVRVETRYCCLRWPRGFKSRHGQESARAAMWRPVEVREAVSDLIPDGLSRTLTAFEHSMLPS